MQLVEDISQQLHESKDSIQDDVPADALAFASFLEMTEHPFTPQFSLETYQQIFTAAFN